MQLREFFGEKKNGETSAMKQILVGDGGTEGTGLKVKWFLRVFGQDLDTYTPSSELPPP